jgi:hypothetical protein
MSKIVNANLENPNGVVIDMTPEEISQLEINKQNAIIERQEYLVKVEAQKQAKVSGNQKLLDLGLTQAEATALTGYTPPVAE